MFKITWTFESGRIEELVRDLKTGTCNHTEEEVMSWMNGTDHPEKMEICVWYY